MRQSRPLYLLLSAAVLIATLTLMTLPEPGDVFAQDAPLAETPTDQPPPPPTEPPGETVVPTEPPGETVVPTEPPGETVVPTEPPGETVEPPGETATPAPPAPVVIPEPITVVLFGTGLAALSAAAASRRKNDSNKDGD